MHSEAVSPITIKMGSMALVPLFVVFAPLVGALVAALFYKNPRRRNATAIIANLISFFLLVYIYAPVVNGIRFGSHLYRGIEVSLPFVFGLGLNFRVDTVSLIFALVTAFVYSLSCIYATSYMSKEHAQTRYFSFVLLTFFANLGVLLAKDFFSLFIFFEMMAIFSYVLVVHEENKQAMEAGKLYIYMSIIGGLALLAGIIFLYAFTGRADIVPMASLIERTMPSVKFVVAGLMIAGFGTKAGLFFLHIWLPEAHPVAPTPASALLSGLMVKVGVYGIVRTVNTLFAPSGLHVEGTTTLNVLGYVLIWAGIITMFGGMVNALISSNCKRLLAYSTVSQIGFIVMGIGCAAYLGRDGAMGMAGTLYHVINHAVFKSALFLAIGAVYFHTHELDMRKLGGLWRNMPLTAMVFLVAVLSIAGIPGFGGFASKTILHHAILEAAEKSSVFRYAELLFMVTCFGTFCYTLKTFVQVFLGERPQVYENVPREPLPMKLALIPLAFVIVALGLRPNFLLESLIGPALAYFGYDPISHPYHILYNAHASGNVIRSTIPLLYDPKTFAFLSSPAVIENISGVATAVFGGSLIFIAGYRFNLFNIEVPDWTSVKFWAVNFAKGFVVTISYPAKFFNSILDAIVTAGMIKLWLPKKRVERARGFALTLLDNTIGFLRNVVGLIRNANSLFDRAVSVILVDLWVSRVGIYVRPPRNHLGGPGGPHPAMATAGASDEYMLIREANRYEAYDPDELGFSFIDVCKLIRRFNDRLDRLATRVFVDSLLAGSATTIVESQLPPPPKKVVFHKRKSSRLEDFSIKVFQLLRDMELVDVCYSIKSFNERLDRLATRVFVDSVLAGSPATILQPPLEASKDRAAAAQGLEDTGFLDNIFIKLFQWLRKHGSSQIVTKIKNLNKRFDELLKSIAVDDSGAKTHHKNLT